jgi:hypothetical protein
MGKGDGAVVDSHDLDSLLRVVGLMSWMRNPAGSQDALATL